jgi:aryl-alcohol dehydrogenase-like predicted oxidoreductase
MQYRTFGKLGWRVSEIGYGMWGMAGWTGSDDELSSRALDRAVDLGCNFFDTAWAYGAGKSEKILAGLLKRHRDKQLYVATKIPPKNNEWPSLKSVGIDAVFPAEHILSYTEKSLKNLNIECIDLLQFHVWEDDWVETEEWQQTIIKLKQEGKVKSFGISVNRWEPTNCLTALATGLIDSVQVIYNIFDQSPEDELFPYCQEHNIAVIARVPFDEGSLTGALTAESSWPANDFRSIYFGPENLAATLARVEQLKQIVPENMTLAELALRFINQHPAVSTIIPGMRQLKNVENNMAVSDAPPLNIELLNEIRKHRWDRIPTAWSN